MKDTRIMIRLTQTEKEAVRQVAAQKGTTITNVVRESFGLDISTGTK
ncbi:hypothetical protein [Nostoc sp.]